jgi:hypothetical protein
MPDITRIDSGPRASGAVIHNRTGRDRGSLMGTL